MSRQPTSAPEIVDIGAGPPYARGVPNLETGEVPRWFDVVVTVRNTADHALHIMASPRKIHFDEASGVLTLSLFEPSPNEPGRLRIPRFLPDFITIPPQSATIVTVSVPEVINQVISSSPEGPQVQQLHAGQLRSVQLSLAFSGEPFRLPDEATTGDIAERLSSWGHVHEVRRVVKRTNTISETEKPAQDREGIDADT